MAKAVVVEKMVYIQTEWGTGGKGNGGPGAEEACVSTVGRPKRGD